MEKAMHTPNGFSNQSILGILLNATAFIFLDMTRYANMSGLAALFAIAASISTIAVNFKNWTKKK